MGIESDVDMMFEYRLCIWAALYLEVEALQWKKCAGFCESVYPVILRQRLL